MVMCTNQATEAHGFTHDTVMTRDDNQILRRLLQFPLTACGRLLPPRMPYRFVQDPRVVCPVHAQFVGLKQVEKEKQEQLI